MGDAANSKPLDELLPALLVCRDLLISKTSLALSKLGLHTLSTGLIVLILWFGLCSAILFLTPRNTKKGRRSTPIVSPVLVTSLVFGLGAQIHPSVSTILGPVVDNIPDIASTGCVLSTAIAAVVFLSFSINTSSKNSSRAYQQTTLKRNFWTAWRRCKYWSFASVVDDLKETTLPEEHLQSKSLSTQLVHFLWVSPVANSKSFGCMGGRRLHWRGLVQQYFGSTIALYFLCLSFCLLMRNHLSNLKTPINQSTPTGLMGSVALANCFLAKQMATQSLLNFPLLIFVCIQFSEHEYVCACQSFVAADREVRRAHLEQGEDPRSTTHGFLSVLVDVACAIIWMPLLNCMQATYMAQENVQGSLVLTSVSVGLSTCGFVMRFSRTADYILDKTWDRNGKFLLAIGWTSLAFEALSFRALGYYVVFFICNWLSLAEDVSRTVDDFLFSSLAKTVTGLEACQAEMAGKTESQAKQAGYSPEAIFVAGISKAQTLPTPQPANPVQSPAPASNGSPHPGTSQPPPITAATNPVQSPAPASNASPNPGTSQPPPITAATNPVQSPAPASNASPNPGTSQPPPIVATNAQMSSGQQTTVVSTSNATPAK